MLSEKCAVPGDEPRLNLRLSVERLLQPGGGSKGAMSLTTLLLQLCPESGSAPLPRAQRWQVSNGPPA